MLEHKMWKLLQTAEENRLFSPHPNVDDWFGGVWQNKGIIITLSFFYLLNKLVYYDLNE